jgi:hypothetical protein
MRKTMRAVLACATLAPVLVLSRVGWAQGAKTAYPAMAPLDQYMMADRDAEIVLARSAAPKSISGDAEVMVLGRHGYDVAVKGSNGFVCMVERAWSAGSDNPNFWNPRIRGPLCLNPAAVRTYLPITLLKTRLVLAGNSKAQMAEAMQAAFDKKQLPGMDAGAMSYMLSKQGVIGDGAGPWFPHLMFFVAGASGKEWGAGLAGSPIFAGPMPEERMRIFFVPVAHWSDGTDAPAGEP